MGDPSWLPFAKTYSLGTSPWNDQETAPGKSSNVPGQPIWDADGKIAPESIAHWDGQVQSSDLEVTDDSMSPWDVVYIGRQPLPGRCSVDVKQTRRIKPNMVAEKDYATLVYKGLEPAEITITCAIWTPAQLNQLLAMMPVLKRPPRDVSQPATVFQALDVRHPALQVLGISQMVIDSLTGLKESGVKGLREMKIHALEYNTSTVPAKGTGKGSSLNAGLLSGRTPRLQLPSGDDSFLAPLVPFKP